jgi:hypothetical protein
MLCERASAIAALRAFDAVLSLKPDDIVAAILREQTLRERQLRRSSRLGDGGAGAGGAFSRGRSGVWCFCEGDATSAPVGGCLVSSWARVGTGGETP